MKDRKTTPSISDGEYQELLKRSKRVSSAPPPISPLDQQPIVSLLTSGFESSKPEPANWEYWKNVATVELGQALLLSINVEPLGGGLLIGNEPKTGWRITPGYLKATGKAEIFDERLHLIRNKLETAYAASGLPPKIDLHTFIRLPLFAAIAIQFGWEPLPCELSTIASLVDLPGDGLERRCAPDIQCESSDTKPKSHIKYLAALHFDNPAATARELRRMCIDRAKAISGGEADPEFPFWLKNNDIALKGKALVIGDRTFSNWFSQAKKLG